MTKPCDVCQTEFDSIRPHARYCSNRCRARAHRAGITKPRKGGRRERATKAAAKNPQITGLLDAVTVTLESHDLIDTVAGQHALELAARIVNAPPLNTGVAALSKQLQSVLAEALGPEEPAAETKPVDPIDELKARRDRKRAH